MTLRDFDEAPVGTELPERRRVVTREDVRDYAGASGDQNPLHLDDEVARAAGFDAVIAHGMFTMGHLASAVTAWAGDPTAVLRLAASFRAPVAMGEELVAGGRVRDADPATRTVTLELWVAVEHPTQRAFAVKKGEAVLRLA